MSDLIPDIRERILRARESSCYPMCLGMCLGKLDGVASGHVSPEDAKAFVNEMTAALSERRHRLLIGLGMENPV